jgi:RNA polymerase sigma-70 factor (ECF subfamily)
MNSETGEPRKRTYDELVTIVYGDLQRRANRQLGGERADSLQPTLLVHEAYQRLLNYTMVFENREHFLNVAATAMRRVLVERARNLSAVKRGCRPVAVTLGDIDVIGALTETPERLIDLDRALDSLKPQQIQLTELRFFAGFTLEETADLMGLKLETVKKRWEVVRTLLFDRLACPRPNSRPADAAGRAPGIR